MNREFRYVEDWVDLLSDMGLGVSDASFYFYHLLEYDKNLKKYMELTEKKLSLFCIKNGWDFKDLKNRLYQAASDKENVKSIYSLRHKGLINEEDFLREAMKTNDESLRMQSSELFEKLKDASCASEFYELKQKIIKILSKALDSEDIERAIECADFNKFETALQSHS